MSNIPTVDKICDKSYADLQDILQLFDNKCFKIVSGADTTAQFCLGDFAFPSDGHSCISMDLSMNGGERLLFDNEILTTGSPDIGIQLETGKLYARGILLTVEYPDEDDNGEEIDISDKKVELWIEDAGSLEWKKLPLYNLLIYTTNPKSNSSIDLINRIKIVNPNELFKIKIKGLIIFGEATES
jgi:hypothetical protein